MIEDNGCSGQYAPALSNSLHPCRFLVKSITHLNSPFGSLVEKGGDYLSALKGNQSTLHDDVILFFENTPKSHINASAIFAKDQSLLRNKIAFIRSHSFCSRQAYGAV